LRRFAPEAGLAWFSADDAEGVARPNGRRA
jgi:hypothetical protein